MNVNTKLNVLLIIVVIIVIAGWVYGLGVLT